MTLHVFGTLRVLWDEQGQEGLPYVVQDHTDDGWRDLAWCATEEVAGAIALAMHLQRDESDGVLEALVRDAVRHQLKEGL